MRIILASQSPRRRELLERMGISRFEIIPARGEERIDPALPPERLVEELSRRKCGEVAAANPYALVIGADTVVSIGGHILGKPSTPQEAAGMLELLSSRKHEVFTGISVQFGGKMLSDWEQIGRAHV